MDDAGQVALFLLACSAAILLAEMQVRQAATTRWVCLALIWITVVGMLLFVYSGA